MLANVAGMTPMAPADDRARFSLAAGSLFRKLESAAYVGHIPDHLCSTTRDERYLRREHERMEPNQVERKTLIHYGLHVYCAKASKPSQMLTELQTPTPNRAVSTNSTSHCAQYTDRQPDTSSSSS